MGDELNEQIYNAINLERMFIDEWHNYMSTQLHGVVIM